MEFLGSFVKVLVSQSPAISGLVTTALQTFGQKNNVDVSSIIKEIPEDKHLQIDKEIDAGIDKKFG